MGLNKSCDLRVSWFGMGFLVVLFISGCATTKTQEKLVYKEGYRAGIKEQMKEIAAQFQGGKFPYYQWQAPLVQEVKVPAHIENGSFIPEHNELVLIKPGQWINAPAYPIANQERVDEKTTLSNDHGSATDITALP